MKLSEGLKEQEQQAISGDWSELAQMFSDFASEAEALEKELDERIDINEQMAFSLDKFRTENQKLKELLKEIDNYLEAHGMERDGLQWYPELLQLLNQNP